MREWRVEAGILGQGTVPARTHHPVGRVGAGAGAGALGDLTTAVQAPAGYLHVIHVPLGVQDVGAC